jgi:preprotein translocase subunit SecG
VFTFLLILLIIDALILIPVELQQAGKGGGLAAMGGGAGTDTLFGGRHAATLLTKLSWWCGGAFIALAFVLQILSSRPAGSESVLQRELQRGAPSSAPATPAPAGGAQNAPAGGAPNPALLGTQAPAGGTTAPATGTTAPANTPAEAPATSGTAPATPAPATPAPANP